MSITAIREQTIELQELIEAVSHPAAGGVASFIGVVRDHHEGRAVTRLEYHVYRSMAEKELTAIANEIEAEIVGVKVACTHRIGELEVGELAVACVASAPHRAEAFMACRTLIDRVKARVPIWKREHGPEGPYWVGWQDARCGDEHGHGDDGGQP